MPNLNKVMLIGHAGRPAELRYTPQGTAVANFSMAVNRPGRGDQQGETDWFNVAVWRDQAERISQQVSKGATVYVEGRVSMRQYESNGQTRTSLEVNANLVLVLSNRPVTPHEAPEPQQQAAPQQQQQSNEDSELPW